jgi:hypothetical protein
MSLLLRQSKSEFWPGMVVHACTPRTQEAEEEGSQVRGQPGLHSEILSLKTKVNSLRENGGWWEIAFWTY